MTDSARLRHATGDPAAWLRYRLCTVPGEPSAIAASAHVFPLLEARDYDRITRFQPAESAPVLLDHARYVDFLARLVDALWRTLGPQARFVLRLRGAFNGALPPQLLDRRVLLGCGLGAAETVGPVAWLQDTIRRDLDQTGDNSLGCRLSSPNWLDVADAAIQSTRPAPTLRLVRSF